MMVEQVWLEEAERQALLKEGRQVDLGRRIQELPLVDPREIVERYGPGNGR